MGDVAGLTDQELNERAAAQWGVPIKEADEINFDEGGEPFIYRRWWGRFNVLLLMEWDGDQWQSKPLEPAYDMNTAHLFARVKDVEVSIFRDTVWIVGKDNPRFPHDGSPRSVASAIVRGILATLQAAALAATGAGEEGR